MQAAIVFVALLLALAGCAGPSRPSTAVSYPATPTYYVVPNTTVVPSTTVVPPTTYTPTTVYVPGAPVAPSTMYVPSASPGYFYTSQAECARVGGLWYPATGICQFR